MHVRLCEKGEAVRVPQEKVRGEQDTDYSCRLQPIPCSEMPLRKSLLAHCLFNKIVLQTFHSFKLSIKIS